MKMNKKLAISELKSLPFSAYKAIANSDFKKFEAATPDKPVFFYINMGHAFPKGKSKEDEADEKGGNTGAVIIFGKPDKPMKEEIKVKTKKEKKTTLAGKGYITLDSKGNKIFNAFVMAGNAPAEKILKAGKKLFSAWGVIAINVLGELGEAALDEVEEEVLSDNQDDAPEKDDTASQEKGLFALIEQYKAMAMNAKPLLALLLGKKTVDSKGQAMVDALAAVINQFKDKLSAAADELKTKFNAALAPMDKILAIISGTGSKEDAQGVNESVKAGEELKKLLEKAKKFLSSLDLETLARR